MIICFFSTSQEPIIGADYSTHPDCIYSEDIDFNPNTQIPVLIKSAKGKYSIEIQDKPLPPETPEQNHSRIYQSIISAESLEGFDLEGELFTDSEVGDIIVKLVFSGNIHAQNALQAKVIAMMLSGAPNPELLQKAQEIEVRINEVRNLFSLGNL